MSDILVFFSIFVSKTMFVISGLFPILNPPGHAPLFLSVTNGIKKTERRFIAKKTAIYCFILIVFTMCFGVYALSLFDLSIDIVEVSGGILVAKLGWEMLGGEKNEISERKSEEIIENTQSNILENAFYPITFPLTVGPGTISVAIALSANLQTVSTGVKEISASILGAVVATGIVCFIIYICYAYAESISDKLGENGKNVLLKLSAFLLFCVGIQILWNGSVNLLQSIK
ncbi:MarC family protein [Erwinia sp. V71]|uniref:MarC family protein n=1 Tax=Enterobacterales TaxID=91347 RepID=UPI003F607F17